MSRVPSELEERKKDMREDVNKCGGGSKKDEVGGGIQVVDKYDYKHIGRVVISTSRRGEGLGFTLMECLFKTYQECTKSYSLYVYKDNTKAKHLYEKLGFKICEETNTFGKNNDCFLMKK